MTEGYGSCRSVTYTNIYAPSSAANHENRSLLFENILEEKGIFGNV